MVYVDLFLQVFMFSVSLRSELFLGKSDFAKKGIRRSCLGPTWWSPDEILLVPPSKIEGTSTVGRALNHALSLTFFNARFSSFRGPKNTV